MSLPKICTCPTVPAAGCPFHHPDASGSLAAMPSSPLRVSYSLAEIEERLKKWMVDEFGHPRDYLTEPEQKDKWYRDYGLIYHFMRDQFPANADLSDSRPL